LGRRAQAADKKEEEAKEDWGCEGFERACSSEWEVVEWWNSDG